MTRMAACRRASSCCTASAAPAAPGTASSAQLDAERYLPLALDLPGHGDAAPTRAAADHASTACVAARARSQPRALRAVRLLAGRARRAARRARRARARQRGWCSSRRSAGHRGRRRARRAPARRRRARRRARDAIPFEEFIERWRSAAAVRRRPAGGRRAARARTSAATDPRALAAVLRGIGTGEMEPLWERLGELDDAGHRRRRRARREVPRARASAWPSGCRDAELAIVPGRSPAAAREPARRRRRAGALS